MTIVRTKTPSGDPIVILPEADFERLVALAEDATDARTLQASRNRLASGADEALSESDLDALRRAPTALAFWRARRGVTTTTLASLGGITEAVLSAMERGERTADTIVYRALAGALGVDPEDLIPDGAGT
ncbi:helix-turn-helix domain-containing protein [Methylobacterium sp. J-078]|uniref:helix-turn-helix domain-containing protein n=1 Tax=Methylobacterium sp. J-078 TaxID=2836657 RepID=UPI001FBA1B41|nr:helix-turn-helix transcriptional regulator [Methylobacterium sp. J-078]MCJ2046618.1 helix-turn-helix domain-containing protein [Methylobacterium sp. J-078]